MGKAQGTRPRGHRIDVWVNESELAKISENSALTQLSRSEYLRNLGLGYQPQSQFDQIAIKELIHLHADQGRLGGLLKLWLSEHLNQGASVYEVRQLLHQIEVLQKELSELILKEKNRL